MLMSKKERLTKRSWLLSLVFVNLNTTHQYNVATKLQTIVDSNQHMKRLQIDMFKNITYGSVQKNITYRTRKLSKNNSLETRNLKSWNIKNRDVFI